MRYRALISTRHGAEKGGAEEGLHERGAVRHQDSDAVATADAECMEPARSLRCGSEELGGRQARVGESEDDVLRGTGRREHEEVAERDDRGRRTVRHRRPPFDNVRRAPD